MLNPEVRAALSEGRFGDAENAAVGATPEELNVLLPLSSVFGNTEGGVPGNMGDIVNAAVSWLLSLDDKTNAMVQVEHLRSQVPRPDKGLPNELAYQQGWHDALDLVAERHELQEEKPWFTQSPNAHWADVCNDCGALVPMDQGDVHINWHKKNDRKGGN